ncbi:hypothetical protein PO124_27955 [Bacillus licheniformis]|nr:hypothetical protein [Bacillus licheniformis]
MGCGGNVAEEIRSTVYAMGILNSFSDGCSPPVFTGDSVERHRLALKKSWSHRRRKPSRRLTR